MDKFFSEYKLICKVAEPRLLGCIIGDGGSGQRQIEKITGGSLAVEGNYITIQGKTRSIVKTTEEMVVNLFLEHTFEAFISQSQTGALLGKNLEILRSIQMHSGAHVSIDKTVYSSHRRKLRVFGRTDSFNAAKKQIFEILSKKIKEELQNDVPNNCFRDVMIEKGDHMVKFVTDQLSPNPSSIFLQFDCKLTSAEEQYNPKKSDDNKFPPATLSKNCGILAPYNGFLYRAKVLGMRTAELGISLVVKFVDFGNVSIVDYFLCRDISKKNLYNPFAVGCKIANIKQEAWSRDILVFFAHYINKYTKNIKVKVVETCSSNENVPVKLSVQNVGDVGSLLVAKGANWNESPFEPISWEKSKTLVGSSDLLYANGGWGGTASIDVVSYTRKCMNEEPYRYTSHFETETMLNSIKTAYSFCRQYLEKLKNDYLSTHTIHITAENMDIQQHQYHGTSAGSVVAICILSECLGLEIPGHIAVTGQISGHGIIQTVGCIREKVLGASNRGKTHMFVPDGNELQAMDIELEGFKVTAIKNMEDLIYTIWGI